MNKRASADFQLFSQLLKMVDGDWSDSIQGICNHVQRKFDSLAVFISVYDNEFDEFIFIDYAFGKIVDDQVQTRQLVLTQKNLLFAFRMIKARNQNFMAGNTSDPIALERMAQTFFLGNKALSREMLARISLRNLFTVPVISANRRFSCNFHIFSEKSQIDAEEKLINRYRSQLNLALEIVFLVRELYIKATHDSLTQLLNHKQGIIQLENEIDRVRRSKQALSIALMDIDFFKRVNDQYGHQAGDLILAEVSSLLVESLRRYDMVSRYGGEEFLIILPDADHRNSLEALHRLKNSIANQAFAYKEDRIHITASFGLVQFDAGLYDDAEALIEAADRRLYAAKTGGRNRIVAIDTK